MTEAAKKKQRILIVDDDKVTSTLLRKKCEENGYEVDYLSDGSEVVANLDTKVHRLILLDVMMPKVSGLEVLKTLRKKYSSTELPIIMITSRDDAEDIAHAFESGANDYIVKPINMVAAMARIKTHLRIRGMHEESLQQKHFDTIKAMIVTYNHEINNPLAIALGHLNIMMKKKDLSYAPKVKSALDRISDIVRKIEQFKYKAAKEEQYVEEAKMFKVD